MAKTIAIAGKGGVGKTTIASLIIDRLSQRGLVLAIDADPSANLHRALGMAMGETVGDIREDLSNAVNKGAFSAGMTKKDFLELKVQEAIVESDSIDLLTMGRPEGPGCYCAVNNMMRSIIDTVGDNYDYVVMDCEAGLEHISRQTTRNIDTLIVVSDPTKRSLDAAAGIKKLIGELRTDVKQMIFIINRLAKELPESLVSYIEKEIRLDSPITIPVDEQLYDLDLEGRPIVGLPPSSILKKGVEAVMKKITLNS